MIVDTANRVQRILRLCVRNNAWGNDNSLYRCDCLFCSMLNSTKSLFYVYTHLVNDIGFSLFRVLSFIFLVVY